MNTWIVLSFDKKDNVSTLMILLTSCGKPPKVWTKASQAIQTLFQLCGLHVLQWLNDMILWHAVVFNWLILFHYWIIKLWLCNSFRRQSLSCHNWHEVYQSTRTVLVLKEKYNLHNTITKQSTLKVFIIYLTTFIIWTKV